MATKIQGSYHGFQVKGDLLDDRSVKFTDASDKDGKPAKFKLAGKSFPNARQAGRAAFDAITDYEKLPRLPDVRFMKLLTVEGKGIGSTAPRQVTKTTKTAKVKTAKPATKTAKSKTKVDEPSEVVTATGVRKSNPKVNQAKNSAAKTARKASPVKTAKVSPKSAKSTKGTAKRNAAKVSAEPDELDF